jgi:cytochrome c-type biogenesis protein CcmH
VERNNQKIQKAVPSDAQDIYPFGYEIQKKLFTKIIHELRCSVCQNQNLTDSMAPLAVNLRHEIYQQVSLGHKESDIIEFVTSRYGEFVLYRPPLQWGTFLLWFGPFILLIIGILIFKKGVNP